MSIYLFKLNGVPDDEAADVRTLLIENEIEFYETSEGKWGISAAAIWLKNEMQLEKAKSLIQEYQRQRVIKVREEYAALKQAGEIDSFVDRIIRKPLLFIIFVAISLLIVYVSIKPFLNFGS
jgi:uncharacterized protein DUF6164